MVGHYYFMKSATQSLTPGIPFLTKTLKIFVSSVSNYSNTNSVDNSVDYTLTTVESEIDAFLLFYRSSFPHATITPKLHMVEDHIVNFIRRWRVGLGMLGEQGAESIHARFNQFERT